MANDYSSTTDALADIVDGNYSSVDYPVMSQFVTAASRLIDNHVGREAGFFYPTTDTVTRYYDGSDGEIQDIDEFASITSVSVAESGGTSSSDYTAWGSTDYITAPYNASSLSKPINQLIIDINGSKAGWYGYRKSVQGVGIAGYSTSVNDTIALATRMQAVRWFMRAKQGYQDMGGSVDVGGLRFTGKSSLDEDVKALLMPFVLELER